MDTSSLSPLEYIPYLGPLQASFSVDKCITWLDNNWYLTVIVSVAYVFAIFVGRKWMENKKPYDLKRPLFLWNFGLAVFSVLGTMSILPLLVHTVFTRGFIDSTCLSAGRHNPHITMWAYFFILSKIVEFGDTAFLVLRKRPLMFLHWYHHITVLMFSWYCLGKLQTGLGHWFGAINYLVHSIMYTYYALVSCGYKVPSKVALIVTIIQLTQMFIGIAINAVLFTYHTEIENCLFNWDVFRAGLVMYLSYAVLFGWYFVKRYILKWRS